MGVGHSRSGRGGLDDFSGRGGSSLLTSGDGDYVGDIAEVDGSVSDDDLVTLDWRSGDGGGEGRGDNGEGAHGDCVVDSWFLVGLI